MSFYYAVNSAIDRANSALNTLYNFNHYEDPRSYRNHEVRDSARRTLVPTWYDLNDRTMNDARYYERVSYRRVDDAIRGRNLLSEATHALVPERGSWDRIDVPLAQQQIRRGIDFLYRARW